VAISLNTEMLLWVLPLSGCPLSMCRSSSWRIRVLVESSEAFAQSGRQNQDARFGGSLLLHEHVETFFVFIDYNYGFWMHNTVSVVNTLHRWRLAQEQLANSIVAFLQVLQEFLVEIDDFHEVAHELSIFIGRQSKIESAGITIAGSGVCGGFTHI
jgi:hypothetical protein